MCGMSRQSKKMVNKTTSTQVSVRVYGGDEEDLPSSDMWLACLLVSPPTMLTERDLQ